MPKTRILRKSKAPPSGTYTSEAKLQQIRFSPRDRLRMPSTKMPTSHRTSNQSTLTQIDFARVVFDSDEESVGSDYVSIGEEKCKGGARKRRKIENKTEKFKHQSTLTQIGFVQPEIFSDEEPERDSEHDAHTFQVNDSQEESDSQMNEVDDDIVKVKEEENHWFERLNNAVSSQALASCSQESPRSKKEDSQLAVKQASTNAIFKTPQKPIKRVIPSSRSPSASPLTPYGISPLKRERTPLEEIPYNVMAMRDMEPCEKVKMESTTASGHEPETVEAGESDRENHDPLPSKRPNLPSGTQHRKHSVQLTSQQEPIGDPVGYLPKLKQPNFSPIMMRDKTAQRNKCAALHESAAVCSSQATTVDLTQPSPGQDLPRSPTLLHFINENQQALASLEPLETESQFLIFTDDLGHYSPLPSVQGSQDIITLSQLLPASMLDD